jgi:hypothetical protein
MPTLNFNFWLGTNFGFNSKICFSKHYEKLRLLKPHYLAIKTQKTTHIQLLCNYLLGITTSV